MLISDTQMPRLLKEDWGGGGTQRLAEELSTMGSANAPIMKQGGTVFQSPPDSTAPPVTLRPWGDVIIRVEGRRGGTGGAGGTNQTPNGDLKLTPEGQLVYVPDPGTFPETVPQNGNGSPGGVAEGNILPEIESSGGGGGGGGIPAKITASLTANSYTVSLFANGSAATSTGTATATVVGSVIDEDEAIAVNSWVSVTQIGSGDSITYEFIADVWA
jgi:hypothetical protein